MSNNVEINEDTLNEMNNQNVKDLFQELKITKGVGKETKYAYSLISNKKIGFKGSFLMGENGEVQTGGGKDKYYHTLISKGSTLPSGKQLPAVGCSVEDELMYLNQNIDYSKFKASRGIDIKTGEHVVVDLIDELHTMVLGGTGSGKSVFITSQLAQMLQNPYTEFYVIDKVDFQSLEGTQKCRYRGVFETMTAQDFFAFKNYFSLEYFRRQALFKKHKVKDYKEYLSLMKQNPDNPEIEKLNYIYILIDEFQSLRKRVSSLINEVIFDNKMKELLDTVRSTGMCFYFGTQDFIKRQIGETRASVISFYFGKMDNTDLKGNEDYIVKSSIVGTNLFYDKQRKSILKIPYSANSAELLRNLSNDPKNRIQDNKIYESLPEMLNDILGKVDSDIFQSMDSGYKLLQIEDETIEKLKNTTEYIPFTILLYVVLRLYKQNLINGKNTDLFQKIDFKNPIDKTMWEENIEVYKNNKKLLGLLDMCFELGQNKEEFLSAFSDIVSNYLNGILGETKLDFSAELGELNETNTTIVNGFLQNNKAANEDKNLILQVGYTGEINPVSFNGMYYISGLTGDVKISSEASHYKNLIKTRIASKMSARQIKQTKNPIAIEIEFTLGIPVKKNGELSKIGKTDLDNLLKATIDGVKSTIIADDDQVFIVKTKINYIEKHNNYHKNNSVNIKVYEFNKETYDGYKNYFVDKKYKAITPEMDFFIQKESKLDIPSVNNMYFVGSDKKFHLSSLAHGYKEYLRHKIDEYLTSHTIKKTSNDVVATISFFIPKTSKNRDLDNMLKATIDSLQGNLLENDKQIREIICFKKFIQDGEPYKAKVKIQLFDFDIFKEIVPDNSISVNLENAYDIFDESDSLSDNDINDDITNDINNYTNDDTNYINQDNDDYDNDDSHNYNENKMVNGNHSNMMSNYTHINDNHFKNTNNNQEGDDYYKNNSIENEINESEIIDIEIDYNETTLLQDNDKDNDTNQSIIINNLSINDNKNENKSDRYNYVKESDKHNTFEQSMNDDLLSFEEDLIEQNKEKKYANNHNIDNIIDLSDELYMPDLIISEVSGNNIDEYSIDNKEDEFDNDSIQLNKYNENYAENIYDNNKPSDFNIEKKYNTSIGIEDNESEYFLDDKNNNNYIKENDNDIAQDNNITNNNIGNDNVGNDGISLEEVFGLDFMDDDINKDTNINHKNDNQYNNDSSFNNNNISELNNDNSKIDYSNENKNSFLGKNDINGSDYVLKKENLSLKNLILNKNKTDSMSDEGSLTGKDLYQSNVNKNNQKNNLNEQAIVLNIEDDVYNTQKLLGLIDDEEEYDNNKGKDDDFFYDIMDDGNEDDLFANLSYEKDKKII